MSNSSIQQCGYDYEMIGKKLDQIFPESFQKVWNRPQYKSDNEFLAKEFPDAIFKCDFFSMCWIVFIVDFLSDSPAGRDHLTHTVEETMAQYRHCSSFSDFFRLYLKENEEYVDNSDKSQTILNFSLDRRNESLTEASQSKTHFFSSRTSLFNYFDGLPAYPSKEKYLIEPKTKHAALWFTGDTHSITEITDNYSQSFEMAFNTVIKDVNDWEYKKEVTDDIHRRVIGIFDGKFIANEANESINLNEILENYQSNIDDFRGEKLIEKKKKRYELRWACRDSNDPELSEALNLLNKQLEDMNSEMTVYNMAGMLLLSLSEKGIFLAYYYARFNMSLQNIKFFLVLVLMRLEILCGVSTIEFDSNEFINPIPHILTALHYEELSQSDLAEIINRIRETVRQYEAEVYNSANRSIDSIRKDFMKYSDEELLHFLRGGKKALLSLKAEDFKLEHLASESVNSGIEHEDSFFKKTGIDHWDYGFFDTFRPYDNKYFDAPDNSRKMLLQYEHDYLILRIFSTTFLFQKKNKEQLYTESFVYNLLSDEELWGINAPQLSGNKSLEELIGESYDGAESYPDDETFKIFPGDMNFKPLAAIANSIRLENQFVEHLSKPLEEIHSLALCLEDCVWVNYFIDNTQVSALREIQLLDEDVSRIRNKIYGNRTEKWIKSEYEYLDRDLQNEKIWAVNKQIFQTILSSCSISQLNAIVSLKDQFLNTIMDQNSSRLWKKYADELMDMITETLNAKADIPVNISQDVQEFLNRHIGMYKTCFLRLFDNSTDGNYIKANAYNRNQQINFSEMLAEVSKYLSAGEYFYQTFVVNNIAQLPDYGSIALEYMKGLEYLLNELIYRPYYLFLCSRNWHQETKNGYTGYSQNYMMKDGRFKSHLEYGTLTKFFMDMDSSDRYKRTTDFYSTRGVDTGKLKEFMRKANKTVPLRNNCAHPNITGASYAKDARYVTYSGEDISISEIEHRLVDIRELIKHLHEIFD